MYYIKYNEIDLTDMVKVRSVEIPSLPAIEHSSIGVFERDGNIYNGLSYNNREIKLTLLIHPERQMINIDPEDPTSPLVYDDYATNELYEQYIRDVKRTFYTKEEARLFCGDETMYMWCVPEGDITISELGAYCAEMEVSLIAYDPYWYSTETHIINNSKLEKDDEGNVVRVNKNKFTVDYSCDVPVYPILSIGFTKDTTFCQIENKTTGEKILIGGKPEKESTTIPKNTKVLNDNMESTSGWTSHSSPIDSGRGVGGSIGITEDGSGIKASNYSGSSDHTWRGACARQLLTKPVKDFMVRVRMNHNSTGTNGDPTHPFDNDYKESTSNTSTTTTYYYEVTPSVGLRLRKGPSTSTAKILTMPKGTKLYPTKIENGWAQVTYNGQTGYCYTQYLAKKASTSTVTTGSDGQCNYVAVKSTAIRASADKTATNKKTIPEGKCIRVYTSTKYPVPPAKEEDRKGEYEIFYKLAKAYDGTTGYVLIDDLVEARDFTVEYDYEVDLADHKTGVCEIYGYSSMGTQLFRMGMYDDNEYYEFTYPVIRKNGSDFLVDKTVAPNPQIREDYNSSGKKVSKVASGRYGDWNEFYGELYIERVNNVWYAYVQKIKDGQVVKEIKSQAETDSNNSSSTLAYLVIYMGTSADNAKDASCMSITHVEVKTATEIVEEVVYNFQEFEVGDILEIDNSIPEVRLNNKECNRLVDVGSSFFALVPGDNTIKVASDDTPNVDVIWSDKNL